MKEERKKDDNESEIPGRLNRPSRGREAAAEEARCSARTAMPRTPRVMLSVPTAALPSKDKP
jgi:hypothetical protein